jgi:hypothetical protein
MVRTKWPPLVAFYKIAPKADPAEASTLNQQALSFPSSGPLPTFCAAFRNEDFGYRSSASKACRQPLKQPVRPTLLENP